MTIDTACPRATQVAVPVPAADWQSFVYFWWVYDSDTVALEVEHVTPDYVYVTLTGLVH